MLLDVLAWVGHCGFEEGDANPSIHDDNEGEWSQVDGGKQHSGVDLPHLWVGPGFPAPIDRAGLILGAESHPEVSLLSHL